MHAFEASKELALLLARAVPQNVVVHNVALSDHAGHAILRTPINKAKGVSRGLLNFARRALPVDEAMRLVVSAQA